MYIDNDYIIVSVLQEWKVMPKPLLKCVPPGNPTLVGADIGRLDVDLIEEDLHKVITVISKHIVSCTKYFLFSLSVFYLNIYNVVTC